MSQFNINAHRCWSAGAVEDSEVAEKAVVPPCPPASGFVMADNMSHRDAESGWCCSRTAFTVVTFTFTGRKFFPFLLCMHGYVARGL